MIYIVLKITFILNESDIKQYINNIIYQEDTVTFTKSIKTKSIVFDKFLQENFDNINIIYK